MARKDKSKLARRIEEILHEKGLLVSSHDEGEDRIIVVEDCENNEVIDLIARRHKK